jgi:DNA invertase Pin-like site-specific DNA recombinase
LPPISRRRKASIDANEVQRLRHDEKLRPAAIARRLSISRASVYRALGKRQAAEGAEGGS